MMRRKFLAASANVAAVHITLSVGHFCAFCVTVYTRRESSLCAERFAQVQI
jgi:hypothetical protein